MKISIPKSFITSPSEDGEEIRPEVGDVVPVDACVRILAEKGDNYEVVLCGIQGNDVGEYGEKEESEVDYAKLKKAAEEADEE